MHSHLLDRKLIAGPSTPAVQPVVASPFEERGAVELLNIVLQNNSSNSEHIGKFRNPLQFAPTQINFR